mgnify:CR=1
LESDVTGKPSDCLPAANGPPPFASLGNEQESCRYDDPTETPITLFACVYLACFLKGAWGPEKRMASGRNR